MDTWFVIFIVVVVIGLSLPEIMRSVKGTQKTNDSLAQQIEAIENTTLFNGDKAKLIQQLIEKYQVAVSNSIPIKNAVELIPVEATNLPVGKR